MGTDFMVQIALMAGIRIGAARALASGPRLLLPGDESWQTDRAQSGGLAAAIRHARGRRAHYPDRRRIRWNGKE